jgi:hypothetical protein
MIKNKVTATVCLFSGRRNPEWEISRKEYDKLLLVIHSLPLAEAPPENFLLGYAGVIVTDGVRKMHAFNSIITLREKEKIKGYTDTGRAIEKSVLHTAPAAVLKEIEGMLPESLH